MNKWTKMTNKSNWLLEWTKPTWIKFSSWLMATKLISNKTSCANFRHLSRFQQMTLQSWDRSATNYTLMINGLFIALHFLSNNCHARCFSYCWLHHQTNLYRYSPPVRCYCFFLCFYHQQLLMLFYGQYLNRNLQSATKQQLEERWTKLM